MNITKKVEATAGLAFAIHHVMLPPKLPQHPEDRVEQKHGIKFMLGILLETVDAFKENSIDEESIHNWNVIADMLKSFQGVFESNHCAQNIQAAILDMESNGIRLFHVKAQNAGIIVQRIKDDFVFSCFELAAQASHVVSATASLNSKFPSHSVSVPATSIRDTPFLGACCKFLEYAHLEQVDSMQPKVMKGDQEISEVRDTSHPYLISELFIAILRAHGTGVASTTITKRIRDECQCRHSLYPWRRSPVWTLLKVGLQLACQRLFKADAEAVEYKNFICLFISKFAELCRNQERGNDDLHIVFCRLYRKLMKLKNRLSGQDMILQFVKDHGNKTLKRLETFLLSSWKITQDNLRIPSVIDGKWLASDNFAFVGLEHSAKRIARTSMPVQDNQRPQAPEPACNPRLTRSDGHLPDQDTFDEECEVALFDFERWVFETLPDAQFPDPNVAIERLSALTEKYIRFAQAEYEGLAEQASIMLLTVVTVWIRVDNLARECWPIIEHYAPAMPSDFLQSCLLKQPIHLEHLEAAETYLAGREAHGMSGSIFGEIDERCLAVQFFEQDMTGKYAHSRATIKGDAEASWQVRQRECRRINKKYESLTTSMNALTCDRKPSRRKPTIKHGKNCRWCILKEERDKLIIKKYEWPLPENDAQCKAVIFELDVPPALAAWRDFGWTIAQDLGRGKKTGPSHNQAELSNHTGLKDSFQDTGSRICLASNVKQLDDTHYAPEELPVQDVNSLLVKHRGQYELYDAATNGWTNLQEAQDVDPARFTTVSLAAGPYQHLQYALDTSDYGLNQVIATQDDAKDLDLHEHHAFGSLRASACLQWPGISSILASPEISLNREEVSTLILHSSLQAGPRMENAETRVSHHILQDDAFVSELLTNIGSRFVAISNNWKEAETLLTLINLVTRIKLSTHNTEHTTKTLQLLDSMRTASASWTCKLSSELDKNAAGSDPTLQSHLNRAALACKATFESCTRDDLNSEEIRAFIDASIFVRTHTCTNSKNLSKLTRRWLYRDWRNRHRLERILRQAVEEEPSAMNRAIRSHWDKLPERQQWSSLESPRERWLETHVSESNDSRIRVLYNLLTGELLVNGLPLGYLPASITSHKTYERLLGRSNPKVIASQMDGMDYETALPFHTHKIYFALRGTRLVVKAERNSIILEHLPHTWFEQDLPVSLVKDHVHWKNCRTGDIEIRQLEYCWQPSTKNWMIREYGTQFEVRAMSNRLLDHTSQFYQDVTQILSPLEDKGHILVTRSDSELLAAYLPRYNLTFVVQVAAERTLFCPQLGAIIDIVQDVGCFIGLKSYLIVRSKGVCSGPSKRKLIVPYGPAKIEQDERHVSIQVTRNQPASQLKFFVYEIDEALKRINSEPGVPRLYQAYLHALTSSVNTDPLTGRTGTEEAIGILQSEWLMEPASDDIVEILEKIKLLSPKREYYPPNLTCMQWQDWHAALPVFSQHEDFEVLADKIMQSGNSFVDFYEDRKPKTLKLRSAHRLIARAGVRNALFRSYGHGGEKNSREKSKVYGSRDQRVWKGPVARAVGDVFRICSVLRDWSPATIGPSADASTTTPLHSIKKAKVVGSFHSDFDWTTLSALLYLDYGLNWGSLYNMCRKSGRCDSPRLAIIFSLIAYGNPDLVSVVETLAAIAISGKFKDCESPSDDSYSLSSGACPDRELIKTIRNCKVRFQAARVNTDDAEDNTARAHREGVDRAAHELDRQLQEQWPCSTPDIPAQNDTYFNMRRLTEGCLVHFKTWFANKSLQEYLVMIEAGLENSITRSVEADISEVKPRDAIDLGTRGLINLDLKTVFENLEFRNARKPAEFLKTLDIKSNRDAGEVQTLDEIFARIKPIDQNYGNSLVESLQHYQRSQFVEPLDDISQYLARLHDEEKQCKDYVERLLNHTIEDYKKLPYLKGVEAPGRLGPRVTVSSVLRLLRKIHSSQSLAKVILRFAYAVAALQRCQRLVRFTETDDIASFCRECEHNGLQGWNPAESPEWLALAIENNFAIRPIQAQVAQEMISPASQKNSTLQLNMGEGKSSVIIHLVAAKLADRGSLPSIIVLKPLMRQMAYLLSQRHKGIAHRRIYYMPVTRKTPLEKMWRQLESLWKDCRTNGGILLVQPEHIQSLQLKAWEQLGKKDELGVFFMRLYEIHRHQTRLIIDESDEVLGVKLQLVYTLGAQAHLEGYPDRWTCQAGLLSIVEDCAKTMGDQGLMINTQNDGCYPTFIFTMKSGGEELVKAVSKRISHEGLPGLSLESCDDTMKAAVHSFIANCSCEGNDYARIKDYFSARDLLQIHVLRGLLVGGLLLHGLREKRWMVNYGLDLSRSKIAVPYKAKGVPSPNAHFAHPEVAILLTYLSYYYSGLTQDQLKETFSKLLRCADPSQEYELWIGRSGILDETLRQVQCVNLDDVSQFHEKLFPAFRYNKRTIDYYLWSTVFPLEGKEYPRRLTQSAYHIPSTGQDPMTTGFSGTNDNKVLLPPSIEQASVSGLEGTSAEVMANVIHAENTCSVLAETENTASQFAELLSKIVQVDKKKRQPQVLIDVGALIIEATNKDVAKQWLEQRPRMLAAIYFDGSDELMVVDSDGKSERFDQSTYRNRLAACLIYLDEYHTRGTDLKLATNARAVVTIAPGLPKDRLVQACMRMRKLGRGQSVEFMLSHEAKKAVLETLGKDKEHHIQPKDLLEYCLRQTCAEQVRLLPLRAGNGIRHRLQELAMKKHNKAADNDPNATEERLLLELSEPDARSPLERYQPGTRFSFIAADDPNRADPVIVEYLTQFNRSNENLFVQQLGDEEQEQERERELEQEVQREEMREPHPKADPSELKITLGLSEYLGNGHFPSERRFLPAAQSLAHASFSHPRLEHLFPELFVSEKFIEPVQLNSDDNLDFYLPPVRYVLTSSKHEKLLIISDFEARFFFEYIRTSRCISLRVYDPRTTKSMMPVDLHGRHSFGGSARGRNTSWTRKQRRSLNAYAGQLYFSSYEEYMEFKNHLDEVAASENASAMQSDESQKEPTPRELMSNLINCRRKGKNFDNTHMGRLLRGETIPRDEFPDNLLQTIAQ